MDYKNALDNLRKQVFTEAAVPENMSSGFIPRQTPGQFNTPKVEKPVDRTHEWLRTIKNSSQKIKEQFGRKEGTSGGLAGGLAKGLTNKIEEKTTKKEPAKDTLSPEVNRETFVKRRGDLPNPYAPMKSAPGTFLEAIDKTEGGADYDTLFGFSNKGKFGGTKISEMTIGELKEFANPSGEYGQWVKGKVGRVATPMGRYQFVGSTMTALSKEMGLSDDTVFTPEVQDKMFEYYLNKRLSSSDTMSGKIAAVRSAWEGFKSIPDKQLENIITSYEAKR